MTDPTPQQGRPEPVPPPAPGPPTGTNPVVPAASGPPTGSIPVVSGPPTGTIPAVPGPPTGTFPAVSGAHTGMIPVVPPPRPRGATALALTLSMLGTVLLVVIAGVIWFGTTGGPSGERGAWNGPVPYPEGLGAATATAHSVTFGKGTTYFWSTAADKKIWFTAVDTETGVVEWSLDEGLEAGREYATTGVEPGRESVLIRIGTSTDDEATYLVESATGRSRAMAKSEGAPVHHRMIGGRPVRSGVGGGDVEVLDATGGKLWGIDDEDLSIDDMVAVARGDDGDGWVATGNPVDAERYVTVDFEGNATQYEARTGKVVDEADSAVEPASDVMLAFDGILYTKSSSTGRDVITAYDMTDGYSEVDSWESEDGQSFTGVRPCGGERICVDGYWPGDSSRAGSVVIDRDEGIVWSAPEDVTSVYAYISFAGDAMAVTYYPDYVTEDQTRTQLFDEDFEPTGEPLTGSFFAVDTETFAAVSRPEEYSDELEPYDAEVSIIDAKDGRVSRLDSYPAYPNCGIQGSKLACPTKNGYRIWDYRD